ncbi:ABC transporter substrate-binding protein [Halopiger xanaduensis]|uniref:ABC-type transporter, periplasmic subunit n=1 Tax=Halopiger xanaduensis (strain DSM 18323 / JCM 14033 / SH-6) TaxID=797210 RepID=F8D8R6_HALXS|nr:ABC transporter substrate-binding protein [Halopiger xanaduensis]AEH37976.1 ABC-type transporter, periplasmic subunit [Halopiger xanaduensis SH-6]
MNDAPSITRRGVLAGAAGIATGSLAGCSERLWSRAENSGPEQVELTIKTLPTEDDEIAAMIMSQFRENLRRAGIAVSHEPVNEADLYRSVLLEGNYDVFIARHPGLDEYDALRGLLHSQFANERGWQNPFHFTDVTVDDHLERQRTTRGTERREVLGDLFEYLGETPPYTTVGFPNRIGGVHDAIDASVPPRRPLDYVDLLSREPDDDSREGPLTVGIYGSGLGERLNPIVVDRNRVPGLLGLLYDPLARRRETRLTNAADGYVPWVADAITWTESDSLEATVTLRDGLTWHDETAFDADDVAFTYRFLQDTSMGEVEGGVPAPRYRDRQTLVETVEAVDDGTVRFAFSDTTRSAAARVFAVPILPQHVWEPRSAIVAEHQPEALVTDNVEAMGSGLFQLHAVTDEGIELEPFADHVLRDETTDRPDVLEGFSQFDGLTYQIEPNPGSMIESLRNGDIDITGSPVPPSELEGIRSGEETSVLTGRTNAFYMIGFNSSQHPDLGNPNFRRILARLIDREHAVREFFGGHGEPATEFSSLLGVRNEEWTFDDRAAASIFPGSDGKIDADRVHALFEDVGYRYEDGSLLG